MDNYLDNFFRKDLDLMGRWWHRFLLVIFVIAFLLITSITLTLMVIDAELPRYKKIAMLSDRMTNKVQLIGNLVQPNEKIAIYEHNLHGSYLGKKFYDGNGDWLLKQEYYCANNISNHVEEVSQITGVKNYKGNSELVSLDEFKTYLTKQGADCIQKLNFSSIKFPADMRNPLNYTLAWGLEVNDMAIWKVSILKSIFAVLLQIFFIVIGFIVLIILYYKVILFIIFGNKK